jgi:thiol:disulfide interchange protein/DsbC/DsbD-like thiol-disulfide interchange protein
MIRMIQLLAVLVATLFSLAQPAFAQGDTLDPNARHVTVTLKSSRAVVAPGEVFHVAIEQEIAPDWHTYWRNPGDSGEPTDAKWVLPEGVTAGPIKWPTPNALPFGPLVNYGYSNKVLLPVEIKVPATVKPGTTLTLAAHVRWLECADICIPGEADVQIDVKVAAAGQNSGDAAQISAELARLPTPFPGTTRLTDLGAGGLQLIVQGVDTPRDAYFFAYEVKLGAVVDFAQPQELVRGKDGFGLSLVKSPSFPADLKSPVSGVLVLGKGGDAKAYVIDAAFEAAPAGSTPNQPASPNVSPSSKAAPSPPGQTSGIGLWLALAMALAGGLILNLMPCVFPILSMKALGLIEASHRDAKAARVHGLWYGGGVVASFLALAGALIALQTAGVAVGWGFQLQSPAIVIGLAILMVWIGFNLLGFYEIGTRLQNIGGGLTASQGASGSFLTGVLAVIVAAPCTAPFMGAALGFATTQAPMISLLVFGVLGLGFALPFVVLTFSPRLLRALPRPGPWMVRLREALAFPMLATAAWLIWVASAQAGQAGVSAALIGVLGAGIAVWIVNRWPSPAGKVAAMFFGLGSLLWATQHVLGAPLTTRVSTENQNRIWSEARVAQLRGEGKTVFVNFTADWCVTCKVNEVSALSDQRVKANLVGDDIVYLVADWTNRNDEIAKALASHNRIGVPLYLVYRPGENEPLILPQILTAEAILDAIK